MTVPPQNSSDLVVVINGNKLDLIDRRSLDCLQFYLPERFLQVDISELEHSGLIEWLAAELADIGLDLASDSIRSRCSTFRVTTGQDYYRVTWEITERCNFRCVHCYLDKKRCSGLDMEKRLRVLDKLEGLGCVALQLTGGEALADPHFESTYRAAWKKGMLISVMTNGQRLSHWLGLFRDMPPHLIRISLYGASASSFAAMTGAPRSAFKDVLDGLEGAQALGIRLRVAIIVGKLNEHEATAMEAMMLQMGVEYHVYSHFSPTLGGNHRPTIHSSGEKRKPIVFGGEKGCSGGKRALHVHVNGKIGPCKLLPHVSINLLSEDVGNLKRISCHSGTRPATPFCATCESSKQCMTCAPVLSLYKKSGSIPERICRRLVSNSG
ncbi:MAG: radical SAM protein [Alphaproteobacteria bacterium]|nr:radical SAM protein [Alphaproteobacteria bacterium]